MPLALWLLLGGVAAYLVYQSGKTAAQTASVLPAPLGSPTTINVKDQVGHMYEMLVDTNLPAAIAANIQTVFSRSSTQTDQSILTLSNQLAAQGYAITAGGVQTLWQTIQASQGPLVQNDSGGGGGIGGFRPNPLQQSSSASAPSPLISRVPSPIPIKPL